MALFMSQQDDRTELQKRLADELAAKAKKKAQMADRERPDGVTDSEFLRESRQTTSFAWIWIVVVVLAVALIIGLLFWT